MIKFENSKTDYEVPIITVIVIENKDIITASGEEWYTGTEENEGIIV